MRIDPWNRFFLIGLIVYVVIRGVFKQRVKSNEMMVRRVDGLEKALMIIVLPGGLLLPAIYLSPREERMMCESFGQEYRDYVLRTGRIFPRMHPKNDN